MSVDKNNKSIIERLSKLNEDSSGIIVMEVFSMLAVIVMAVALIISNTSNNEDIYSDGTIQQINGIVEQETDTPDDSTNFVLTTTDKLLKLRSVDEERTYGSIKTHLFEIIDATTNEPAKLVDGKLSLEDIVAEINIYLNDNKYRTMSVGIVDNKFYVQQDTSKPVEGNIHVMIATLGSKFTLSDWLSLTESVYNNTDFHADSVFSYEANGGTKQYIYIYSDIAEDSETNKED